MGVSPNTFLRTCGAAAAYAACQPAARGAAAGAERADLLLINGLVVTFSEQTRVVTTLAVADQRALAVGSTKDLRPRFADAGRIVDLRGRSVTPGLIDAHGHVIGFGQMERSFAVTRPPQEDSFDTLQRVLRQAVASRPKGEWNDEKALGSLQPGRAADFVIWNRDVTAIRDASGIDGPAVEEPTWTAHLCSAHRGDPRLRASLFSW